MYCVVCLKSAARMSVMCFLGERTSKPGCEVRFCDKQIIGFFVGEVQVGARVKAGVELHDAHSLPALQLVSHFHQLLLSILHKHVGVVLQQDLASVAPNSRCHQA